MSAPFPSKQQGCEGFITPKSIRVYDIWKTGNLITYRFIVEEMSEAVPFAENVDEYKEAIETIYAKCSIIPENERFKHIIER